MYVCLCGAVTCQAVNDAVASGASTCKQVAAACGAGRDCGRCVRNLKAIIEKHSTRPVAAVS
ncbi:MAG: (2Fe-2S)-binding protein [Mycobacteriaceae bacterium]